MTLHSSLRTLAGRSLLSIADLSPLELNGLLDQAQTYKQTYKHQQNWQHQPLAGDNIAMIFQKRSTRTRISTEVGMSKLGGHALFLSADDIQLNVNESIQDTAQVLSRFNDLILARVYGHQDVIDLTKYSTVPVINALTDKHHPLQTLADYLTLKEHFGSLDGLTLAWVGDGNNIIHDLMLGAPKLGVSVKIATPTGYEPDEDILKETLELAKVAGTSVVTTTDPAEAVEGANVVVTDTWVSMGQEEEYERRVREFAGYQVTNDLMKQAASDSVFLHCLPRHKEEVADEVFYSKRSLVFDEAENRMWTVMAVMSALLGKHD